MWHTVFIHTFYCDIWCPAKSVYNLTQITNRTAVTNEVDITDISNTIRINAVEVLSTVIIEDATSCLTKVVITGPGKVTNYMMVPLYDIPQS